MPILDNEEIEAFELPGIKQWKVGRYQQGVRSMEMRMQQAIAPGASTLILIFEPDIVHRIVSTSTEEMNFVLALVAAPVRVKSAVGESMPVPWEVP